MNRFLWWLMHKLSLRCTVIDIDDNEYLSRFFVLHTARGVLPGVYLHHFHRSDNDRDLHNHPWRRSFSLILSGGYEEERLDPTTGEIRRREFRPGAINKIGYNDFHRVDLLNKEEGCWSLFFAGKRMQEWGFLDRDSGEFYPHTKYFDRKVAKGGLPNKRSG